MLKLGVVGVGSMGQNHARIYGEMGCLSGVFDVFPDQATKIAKKFGTTCYKEVDELIDRVDALSICTPTSNHFEVALKVIKAGKSLLLEKPFTGDAEKARILCEEAEKQGITLASGFVERFNPIVHATGDSLASGRFGKLVTISSRRVSSFPTRIHDVGVIMDLAIHDVDVIRFLTGSKIVAVYARGGKMNNSRYEDYANILMELENGTTGIVEANWLTPMKVRKVSLTCLNGFAQMDYTDQSLEFSTAQMQNVDLSNMSHIPMELDTHHIVVRKEEPLKRELESFVKATSASSKAEIDGWDALNNITVCASALQSLESNKRVKIKEI
jgi:UDP-N-acetylglucosamine 3-dehydrogenase